MPTLEFTPTIANYRNESRPDIECYLMWHIKYNDLLSIYALMKKDFKEVNRNHDDFSHASMVMTLHSANKKDKRVYDALLFACRRRNLIPAEMYHSIITDLVKRGQYNV